MLDIAMDCGSCSSSCPPSKQQVEQDVPPRVLHLGMTATVVTGRIHRQTCDEVGGEKPSQTVAIKRIDKAQLFGVAELEAARFEIELQNQLRHPCILSLLRGVEAEDYLLLVTPLCNRGDLHQVTQFITIRECDCRCFSDQLLHVLEYIHAAGFIHGDLKPHNVLLQQRACGRHTIQLCDFGLAARLPDRGRLRFTGLRGTSGYFSPEELRKEDYGRPSDVWVAGLILYKLLAGYAPFYPPADFGSGPQFDAEYWAHVSNAGCSFVEALLRLDQHQRLTAAQALKDDWFSGTLEETSLQAPTEELSLLGPFAPQALPFFTFDEVISQAHC